jgi:acetyl esterase
MPVDPQIQALLDLRAALPPMHTLSVAEARAQVVPIEVPELRVPAVAEVRQQEIPGPAGPLAVRLYTPRGQGPFPLMVFFHGSGFVVCSLDTHDAMCRNLAAGSGCLVASVDYRLAPEHRFPAAPEDCLAATRWLAPHAAELGADRGRVLVAGDSAGGNLATVTALRIRDEGGPALIGQLLIYPVTDHVDADYHSYVENAEGYGLTTDGMRWFWRHYLGNAADAAHPHAAPMRAANLAGLPPALIVTAQYDPLRDEAEAYGERLRLAGVPVEIRRWNGVNHGFFFVPGLVDRASAAIDEATAWVRRITATDRRSP